MSSKHLRNHPTERVGGAKMNVPLCTKESSQTRQYRRNIIPAVFLIFATLVVISAVRGQQISFIPNWVFFPNPGGASQTYTTARGGIDVTGPFFQSLSTNGR